MSAAAERRTALITGASSGIGYELSKLAAQDGHDLILVARGQAALDRVADEIRSRYHVEARTIAKDLGSTSAAAEIVDELERDGTTVDILINNAGFGDIGPFADSAPDKLLSMLQVNVAAPTLLTRLLLPGMRERRRGRIMNVASTAAYMPGPYMAVYYASKAYVLSFSQALADELRGSGITVTALCPGPTATEFASRAGTRSTRLFNSGMTMRADTVARIGYQGMQQGRTVVVPGLMNQLTVFSTWLLPRRVTTAFTRAMHAGS